jgi:hypothetical protein
MLGPDERPTSTLKTIHIVANNFVAILISLHLNTFNIKYFSSRIVLQFFIECIFEWATQPGSKPNDYDNSTNSNCSTPTINVLCHTVVIAIKSYSHVSTKNSNNHKPADFIPLGAWHGLQVWFSVEANEPIKNHVSKDDQLGVVISI